MQKLSLGEFSIYTDKILSSSSAYAIKANAEALGLNEALQVENAGAAVANRIRKAHKNAKMLFICGAGGKGAVGLSAARHLSDYSEIVACFLGSLDGISNETTRLNYTLLSDILEIHDVEAGESAIVKAEARDADIIVDAITGIGLRGKLHEDTAKIIGIINDAKRHLVSIDIPSGVNPDIGDATGAYVHADELLALHKLKSGIMGSTFVGSTTVLDIGIPISAELLTGAGDVRLAALSRPANANKYTVGSVLVVGGGEEYHGAPILAANAANSALAALRTGAGYATIFAPKSKAEIIRKLSPNIIVRAYKDENLSKDVVAGVENIRHDVAVIGPGLGKGEDVYDGIAALVENETRAGKLILLDGDAIGAIARHKRLLGKNIVLTPHHGEFSALVGVDQKDAEPEQLANRAISFAKNYNCVIVLKGHETFISDGNRLKINRAKSSALATMGTGDVLSGIIGAYLAMNRRPFESATAGVYLHSVIGDALNKSHGNHILAEDVILGIRDLAGSLGSGKGVLV
jgi:NAD(P)H-hydrate epimerase